MKTLSVKPLLSILASVLLTLLAACSWSPTRARVRVLEHRVQSDGTVAILCVVLSPENLAGRFSLATTRCSDQVARIDGALFDVRLSVSMVASLSDTRPKNYFVSAPWSRDDDFIESAEPAP